MKGEALATVRQKLVEMAHNAADVLEILVDDSAETPRKSRKRGRAPYQPSETVSEMDKMAATRLAREQGWTE